MELFKCVSHLMTKVNVFCSVLHLRTVLTASCSWPSFKMKEHQKIIHPSRLTERLWDISCRKDWKHSQRRVWRGVYGTLGIAPEFKTNPVQSGLLTHRELLFFSVHNYTASLHPQLSVFHSTQISRPKANLSMA